MQVAITRISPGQYSTTDGRYTVERVEDYETECDGPHPARMSADNYNALCEHSKILVMTSRGAKLRPNGSVSYYCEGGETHYYTRWIVWNNEADDYAQGTGPDGFDTLRDAKRFLSGLLARVHAN